MGYSTKNSSIIKPLKGTRKIDKYGRGGVCHQYLRGGRA